jgi:hypothetical protein
MPQLRKTDFNQVADYICDELETRRTDRKDFDKEMKEIDRQLAMKPDISHKLDGNGRPVPDLAWLPEVELPLQSQTLEVLTADSRRMMLPDSGTWFESIAMVDDEYLSKVDFESFIPGDENEVPSLITQDNANQLVTGVLNHWHGQYDFGHHIDLINAESFKYGMGIGIPKMVTKNVLMHTAKGVIKQNQRFPVLIPGSIKNTYLDTKFNAVMCEGLALGPSEISCKKMRLEDLKKAANKGSKDPLNENGGWMPAALKDLTPDKNNLVEVVEMDGDFVVPRKTTDNILIENAIITVAIGQGDKKVVRIRYKKFDFPTKIRFPYHCEHIDNPYSTSPLRKGSPIQKAAVHALSKYMEVAALHAGAIVQYDRDDQTFASEGGPRIHPYAQWGTTGETKIHQIGDPQAMFNTYVGLLSQYSDVTGINAPRLGAQTTSHTTAFAKEAEINRGTVRTVDYVRNTLKGPLNQWLSIAYKMGREEMKKDVIYIEPYNGFVELDKNRLPEEAIFNIYGSGTPAEEAQKEQKRMTALQTAMQMDQLNIQLGNQPILDLEKGIEQVLRKGEWTDVDAITRTKEVSQGAEDQSLMGTDIGSVAEADLNALQA